LNRKQAGFSSVRGLAVLIGLAITACAQAQRTLDVQVTSTSGQPLQYAAVLVGWAGASAPTAPLIPPVMNQHNMQFEPHMLVVPVGSAVVFPNQDQTRHHVYSFSRAKTFDIKLYIGRPERPIVFDTPGVVTLGCNIHDRMQAYIVVSDEPRWAITDALGRARINGLPDTALNLTLWQPWMTSEQTRVHQAVADGQTSVDVQLDVTPPPTLPTSTGPSLQDRFDALAR